MPRTTPIDPNIQRPVAFRELAEEPFRGLFPAAVLAGVLGAFLWPLHLWFGLGAYPGPQHAELMVCGFFGGFIFGFLGTAAPRLLSAPSLQIWQVSLLWILHLAMTMAFTIGAVAIGNAIFIAETLLLGSFLIFSVARRQSFPPPGVILVAVALMCAVVGAAIGWKATTAELDPFWVQFHKLVLYQGFVLLPILGVGPFLFPRFFGADSLHDFTESGPAVPKGWVRELMISAVVGGVVLATFCMEALGWVRLGPGLRASVVLWHLWRTLPWGASPRTGKSVAWMLRIGLFGIVGGLGIRSLIPAFHIAWMHWVFIGGIALVTLATATRVVSGHSGARHLLEGRARWLAVVVGLILIGMWTRISGDFWPKIQKTHYSYGALLWIVGLLLWAWFVLPHVRWAEKE